MTSLNNDELKRTLITKLFEKMIEKDDINTDEAVLLMRALGRYAEEHYEIPPTIKKQMTKFIETNEDTVTMIFNSDIETIMAFLRQKYINWESQETFESLATINEFYVALMGLWMIDEYDPTEGKAWSLLTETTSYVENNMNRFTPSKKMVSHFHNPSSMNPIQDLWKAMKGHPTISV
jgi:polyhydroxyalkanoate synthesis regulator phasin